LATNAGGAKSASPRHRQGTVFHSQQKDFAMHGMTGFLIAVGGVSLICFWLMMRTQNAAARRSSSDGSGSDSSYSGSSSGTGWSLSNWFGGDGSSSHSSGFSSDSGSSDSGGGDSGGGGGGD